MVEALQEAGQTEAYIREKIAEKYERTIRSNEFLKSLWDRELQKKLFVEFGLEEGK